MNTTIEYYRKNVWGNDLFYIKNDEEANLISRLNNKKTIDQRDMETLKALGFELKEVLQY